jgi:ABC-type glycerol-3-phosphate transport system permease component
MSGFNKKPGSIHFGELLLHLLMVLFCISVLFPVFYAVMVSLSPPRMGMLRIIPETFHFGHYHRLFAHGRFPRYIFNSIINAGGGTLLSTVFAAMTGYAVSRLKFRGRNLVFGYMFFLLMLPQLTNMVPLYKVASDLRILNTYGLMIAVFGAYGVPLAVFIMKGFFDSIPRVLEEAACIDGATPFQAFWQVVVPVAAPGLVATLLINFVYSWNNFFTPLILITKTEMKMATVGLYDFQHVLEGNQDELLAAACVVIMVPAILLFLAMRKYFLQGIVEGAVKG